MPFGKNEISYTFFGKTLIPNTRRSAYPVRLPCGRMRFVRKRLDDCHARTACVFASRNQPKESTMYRNEVSPPALAPAAVMMATQKDKKHSNEDNTHTHSEEHPRA